MVTIGLMGVGFMGQAHYEAYKNIPGCRVVAIGTSRSREELPMEVSETVSLVASFEELVNDEEIDIIDICLPTYLHEEFIMKAAAAGKHIICEKPLTLTLESAQRIKKVVDEKGVSLFVGHILRFWPEYSLIHSKLERGVLRNVDIVHAKRLGHSPSWSNWFQDAKKSGGALYDLHIHDIDYIYYLLGEVESLYAVGKQNKAGAWDHILTTLTFKSGSIASVEASHRMPLEYPFTMVFRAQDDENTIEFRSQSKHNIDNLESGVHGLQMITNESMTNIEVEQSDPFQKELAYFIDCVRNKSENTKVPLEDVLYTLTLLQAIEKSLMNGCKIIL